MLLPFQEGGPNESLGHLDVLDLDGFDLIVTHGKAGEYGHKHHIQLHEHIAARWPEKTITIGYRKGGIGATAFRLSDEEWDQKLRALKCYDHKAPADGGKPKWQALLDRYGDEFDFRKESYDVIG